MPTRFDVGFVNITSNDEIYYIDWVIDGFFYFYPSKRTSWRSKPFIMWDEKWLFDLYPNGDSKFEGDNDKISLYLGTPSLSCRVDFVFITGIRKGCSSIFKSSQVGAFDGKFAKCDGFLERSELIRNRNVIAPNGRVTFFMAISLQSDIRIERLLTDSEKGRSGNGTANEEKASKHQPSSEEGEHDHENKGESELFDATDTAELTQSLKNALLNGNNSDLHLKVRQRDFNAHKMILSARSTVFATMLEHDMVENRSKIIDIPDCDPDAFHDFLLYLYTANVDNFSKATVTSLYYIADKYNVKQLALHCLKFMVKNISVKSFCDIITLAVKHSESELIKTAEKFFAENVKEILINVKWQSFIKENPTIANELFIKYANNFNKRNHYFEKNKKINMY